MSRSYKADLRENRAAFLMEMKGKYGELPAAALWAYDRKAMAIQNETRGKLGELIGEVNLTASGAAAEADIVRDKMQFDTPLGVRRIDVWQASQKHATEVKSGYTCLSQFVRKQIQKDVFLRTQGVVQRLTWLLLHGGSRPLLAHLDAHNVEVLSGWPDFAQMPKNVTQRAAGSRSVTRGEWKTT